MTELIFDRDPVTKTVQTFHYDPVADEFTIQDQQDVTALLERNKRLQNEERPKGEGHVVATIPGNILADLYKTWREQGLSWHEKQEAMKRWLNDPDNKLFRTTLEHV